MNVQTGGKHDMSVETLGDTKVVLERFFDAPRDLVWRLWVDPARLPEWWGPRAYETRVEAFELRIGGRWHMVHSDPSGQSPDNEFYGEFREIDPPATLTWTFTWGGMPDAMSIERVEFLEQDGGTLMRATADYGSSEGVAGIIDSGMAEGAAQTYDRFEELLDRVGSTVRR